MSNVSTFKEAKTADSKSVDEVSDIQNVEKQQNNNELSDESDKIES